jgi:hypothetical protein
MPKTSTYYVYNILHFFLIYYLSILSTMFLINYVLILYFCFLNEVSTPYLSFLRPCRYIHTKYKVGVSRYILQYLHSPCPFSYISFDFIWTIKCMCVAKLVWSGFSALRPASFTNIDFFMRCFTLHNYLAVPPKLKYDVCRKILYSNTKM